MKNLFTILFFLPIFCFSQEVKQTQIRGIAFDTLTYGATVTWDFPGRVNAILTLRGDANLVFTNLHNGNNWTLIVIQDGTGGHELTVPSQILTINAGAGDTTIVSGFFDGTSYYWSSSASSGISNIRVAPIDSLTKDPNGIQVVNGNVIVPQTADGTYPGLMSTLSQTLKGVKTYTDYIIADTVYGGTANGQIMKILPTSHVLKSGYVAIGAYDNSSGIWVNTADNEVSIGSNSDYGGVTSYKLQVHVNSVFGDGQTDALQRFTCSSDGGGSSSIQFTQNNGTEIGRLRAGMSTNSNTFGGVSYANIMQLLGLSGSIMLATAGSPIYFIPANNANVVTNQSAAGKWRIGSSSAATGWMHLPAGSTTVPSLIIDTTGQALLTTPIPGVFEQKRDSLYWTGYSGTRYKIYPQSSSAAVDTIYRTPGKDSIQFTIGGRYHAIKDSIGSTPTLSKGFVIESPTSSEDIKLFYTDVAITISKVADVVIGSSTPSVTYQINHASTADNVSPNLLFSSGRAVTSTSGATTTTFNDATIPAGSWVWITTSAQSGTVNSLSITLTYTND